MSPAGDYEGGIPRGRQGALPPKRASMEEDWSRANETKVDKLRRNSLQRQARARGLELRHSAHGYSLIDRAHERVDGRNDMTLAEVESRLAIG